MCCFTDRRIGRIGSDIGLEGDKEFFYKVVPFNGVRAALLIDVQGISGPSICDEGYW